MSTRHNVAGYWPARRESVRECADRLSQFLKSLRESDTIFSDWYEAVQSPNQKPGRRIDLSDSAHLESLLERGRNRTDLDGEVIEELGFRVFLWNGLKGDSSIGLNVGCGIYLQSRVSSGGGLGNAVVLSLPKNRPDLFRAEMMVRLLFRTAEVWEPAWAGVMATDAMAARKFKASSPFVDWMVYLPSGVQTVPEPSRLYPGPHSGTIVVVQPIPPVIENLEDQQRVRLIQGILTGTKH